MLGLGLASSSFVTFAGFAEGGGEKAQNLLDLTRRMRTRGSAPSSATHPKTDDTVRLSKCLFYAIFVLAMSSFVAMDMIIRHSCRQTPTKMRGFVQARRLRMKEGDSPSPPTRSRGPPRVYSYFNDKMIEGATVAAGSVHLSEAFGDRGSASSGADDDVQSAVSTEGECVPIKAWQRMYYPSCNEIHGLDMIHHSQSPGGDASLIGLDGYWRDAYKIDYGCRKFATNETAQCDESIILKTLKLRHDVEESQLEKNRIDSMAMERLTKSPHIIDLFGACGTSVLTEFADGENGRVGTLADKEKKRPLKRLRIARDIASGLADVHEIDGPGQATLAHFDVNLANVVSVKKTLKLNDFNIAVPIRRNTTSGEACGFEARFPNPQWRSPEEANGSTHLTEKVDVFSLGHILFRLICLHEPWHKLEEGYVKGEEIQKDVVSAKVRRGEMPAMPKEVLETDDIEVLWIRHAMMAAYTYDPAKRPSAREIAVFLDRGLADLSKLTHLRRPGHDKFGSFRVGKLKDLPPLTH